MSNHFVLLLTYMDHFIVQKITKIFNKKMEQLKNIIDNINSDDLIENNIFKIANKLKSENEIVTGDFITYVLNCFKFYYLMQIK